MNRLDSERAARAKQRKGGLAPALLLLLALAGCATSPAWREPANLDPHKRQLRAYVESKQYDRDIAAVAAKARAWIEQRVTKRAPGERLTAIFDVDETLLSNWPHLDAQDFGYIRADWNVWVESAQAPAIEPVRDVFLAARKAGVEIVVITGRREREREGTERNLREIGCGDYVVLICKPDEARGSSAAFKAAARRQLVEQGRVIVANIGDQESDFADGFAERTFKLPCPFYFSE